MRHVGSFGGQLSRVVLEEGILFGKSLFHMLEQLGLLFLRQLVLDDLLALKHGYELLALARNVSRKGGPANLRVEEGFLRVLLFLLEGDKGLLHLL